MDSAIATIHLRVDHGDWLAPRRVLLVLFYVCLDFVWLFNNFLIILFYFIKLTNRGGFSNQVRWLLSRLICDLSSRSLCVLRTVMLLNCHRCAIIPSDTCGHNCTSHSLWVMIRSRLQSAAKHRPPVKIAKGCSVRSFTLDRPLCEVWGLAVSHGRRHYGDHLPWTRKFIKNHLL